MAKTGWNRKLGTSKREQGIITPKAPKAYKCGCIFHKSKLLFECFNHIVIRKRKEKLEKSKQFAKQLKFIKNIKDKLKKK